MNSVGEKKNLRGNRKGEAGRITFRAPTMCQPVGIYRLIFSAQLTAFVCERLRLRRVKRFSVTDLCAAAGIQARISWFQAFCSFL